MLVNQPQLPRLPVPLLKDTLGKVLRSAEALGSAEELEALKGKADEFGRPGGVGERLQQRLEQRREEKDRRSWIAEWWDQAGYFTYRDSVVVNVSYYYGFVRLPQAPPSTSSDINKSNKSDPAYVAASIAKTALEFRRLITSGELEPEKIKGGGELCMESYKWAFNACRVPAPGADYAVKIPELSSEGQHITLVHRNRFYVLPFLTATGEELSVEQLREAVQGVLDGGKAHEHGVGVGVLTGINRDRWSDAHHALLTSSSLNKATIESIRSSAFLIALDEAQPATETRDQMAEFSSLIWKAGEGKEAANRWWDKPLQWVVFGNGEAGFIGEHSCMDGTPTARLNDFLTRRLATDQPVSIGVDAPASGALLPVQELDWELDDKLLESVKDAQKEFEGHVREYEVQYVDYRRYGKEGIKKCKVSPDAWVQMLFQLAYYMTHNHPCGTYEAAQVRKYQLGRTETVRTCTVESVAFTKAMLEAASTPEERKEKLAAAVKAHGRDMGEASNAHGVDRHLFGLKMIREQGDKADFLEDQLLQRSGTWKMSTSQIYIERAPGYGWGPVAEGGYGLPYMIHPDNLQLTVTYKKGTPGKEFADNFEKAADMLWELMASDEGGRKPKM